MILPGTEKHFTELYPISCVTLSRNHVGDDEKRLVVEFEGPILPDDEFEALQ